MKRKQSSINWSVVRIFGVLIVVVAVIAIAALTQRQDKNINSFQACKDAGGAIAESYPEQCSLNGKSFTNDKQPLDTNGDEYISLSEQEALDKASRANKTARVVERDGEPLAVTADFMPGRLNIYVKDGKVHQVQVEGQGY